MSGFRCRCGNVEDLPFERSIDICHETVHFWWNKFGPMFAGDIRRQRATGTAIDVLEFCDLAVALGHDPRLLLATVFTRRPCEG